MSAQVASSHQAIPSAQNWTSCTAQFKVKLNVMSQDEHACSADIALYAKNATTLEEYVHREGNFNSTFLNKLDKWITKKKYTITQEEEGANTLHLQIEIFSFTLCKIHRDDMEVLKDEFRALKKTGTQLQKELLLSNYQFFTHANESNLKRRLLENLPLPPASGVKREPLIDNVEASFDKFECIGIENGSDRWWLAFKEPIPYEIGGKIRNLEGLLWNVGDESGRGGAKIVNVVKSGFQNVQIPERDGLNQQWYQYEVDKPVRNGQEYEWMVSKMHRIG